MIKNPHLHGLLSRKTIVLLGGTATLATLLFSYSLALAASTATVAATVTVQDIAVTVTSSGTVAWGTLPVNTASSTNAAYSQTVENSGNVAEDFTIEGSNSADWTLDTTNSTENHYVQEVCTATCATAPTNYNTLSSSGNVALASDVATSGTQTFDLYIKTPQSVSTYTQQSVDVTITAAAH